MWRGLESWVCKALRRRLRGNLGALYNYLIGRAERRKGQIHLRGVQKEVKRQLTQLEREKFGCYMKKMFHLEDGLTLGKTLKSSEISILEDTKNLTAHAPELLL